MCLSLFISNNFLPKMKRMIQKRWLESFFWCIFLINQKHWHCSKQSRVINDKVLVRKINIHRLHFYYKIAKSTKNNLVNKQDWSRLQAQIDFCQMPLKDWWLCGTPPVFLTHVKKATPLLHHVWRQKKTDRKKPSLTKTIGAHIFLSKKHLMGTRLLSL